MNRCRPPVPTSRYYPVYLGDVDALLIREMLESLVSELLAGRLTPLPKRIYPISDAVGAFRFMAQAKHVGKIVLTLAGGGDLAIRADATYLVTGGFGNLGLAVAEWLAARGARRLALVGRSGPSTSAAAAGVARLEASGVEVLSISADIGRGDDAARVFGQLEGGGPLRGIVHAAGVVDDGTIEQLGWEDFERVFGPKIYGAWQLHRHAQSHPLDFFVMFSSASALIGTPGQGNYASANAFLDAVAHHRRAAGLPAVSINWGPWGGIGMATALNAQAQTRWTRLGIGLIDRRQGLAVLEQAIAAGVAQLGVLPVDWHQLSQSLPDGSASTLLAELSTKRDPRRGAAPVRPARPVLIELLAQVPGKGRLAAIQSHVRDVVKAVLGVEPSFTIELSHGLRELGMDSLMAVELRNHLQAAIGRPLPSTLAFDRPTIAALAGYLEQLVGEAPQTVQPLVTAPAPSELDELSDEDAELLLAQELER